jgi:predicted ATPase/signal transduction histidine kinase
MTLLAKNAESRYQSTEGLLSDLIQIKSILSSDQPKRTFSLKQLDFNPTFRAPKRIYGRETELNQLISAYEQAKQGYFHFTLVTGDPGIGKSALVHELKRHVLARSGFFLTGKYDQFYRSHPFSAIKEALEGFLDQVLAETDQQYLRWKNVLNESLGAWSDVLLEFSPRFEIIFGKGSPISKMSPDEAQNRLMLTLEKLIECIASPGSPLILFLDDLQWADAASLRLIQYLCSSKQNKNLLLIGAYRQNEISPDHPLSLVLNSLKNNGIQVDLLFLRELNSQAMKSMLGEIFGQAVNSFEPIADLIGKKTAGNPFYVFQLLETVYLEKIIVFHPEKGWQLDYEKFSLLNIHESLIQVIQRRLNYLPEKTLEILKTASCFGSAFQAELLSQVTKEPLETVERVLTEASKLELVYRFVSQNSKVLFSFLHDQIRESVLNLVSLQERKSTQHQIGHILLDKQGVSGGNLFTILGYLNESIPEVPSDEEVDLLISLNIKAAHKASISTAYDSAVKYLTMAKDIFEEFERSDSLLRFQIYHDLAECTYLSGDFPASEELFEYCLRNVATTKFEKATLWRTRLASYNIQGSWKRSIFAALEGLKLLDYPMTADPNLFSVYWPLIQFKYEMRDMTERLSELPEISDPRDSLIANILYFMGDASFHFISTQPLLMPYIACKLMSFTLQRGKSSYGVANILQFALIMGIVFSDHRREYELGLLSLKLGANDENRQILARMLVTFYGCVSTLGVADQKTLSELTNAYQASIKCGNLQYAANAASGKITFMLINGYHLNKIEEELTQHTDLFLKKQATLPRDICLGSVRPFLKAMQEGFKDENEFHSYTCLEVPSNELVPMAQFHFLLYRAEAAYLSGFLDLAYRYILETNKILHAGNSTAFLPEFYFFDCLVRSQMFSKLGPAEKLKNQLKIRLHLRRLKEYADSCSENFLHRYLFALASFEESLSHDLKALQLYSEALSHAHEAQYLHHEAMINERLGHLFFKLGSEITGRYHVLEAIKLYSDWGSPVIADRLRKKYQFAAENTAPHESAELSIVDLIAVLKVSQVLAEERNTENLLTRLLNIAIENTGAERGVLTVTNKNISVAKSNHQASVEPSQVPWQIINYVTRTLQSVVLTHSRGYESFSGDPYLASNKPKSVLCLPILKQSELIGTLYLENRSTLDTFSKKRVDIVKMICTQSATFIENAKLYTELERLNKELEDLVKERTYELEKTVRNLSVSNSELDIALGELKETQARLIHSSKMSALGEMAGGIAHEINNPLAIVKLSSHLLRTIIDSADFAEKEKIIHISNNIDKTVDRIAKIVNGLRTFARDESAAPFQSIRVSVLIEDALSLCGEKFKMEGIRVFLEDQALNTEVECQHIQVSQILLNLLNNSRDAIHSKKDRWVKIETSVNGESVEISVTDSGSGIDQKIRSKIFQPFFSTKNIGDGTGLGLSISRGIAAAHKGDLFLDERTDHTRFVLRLPRSQSKNNHVVGA